MYFWFLHFGSFFDLVFKLILLLLQSLKLENRYYFGLCRQLTDRKYISNKRNTLFVDVANNIYIYIYIYINLAFSKCHITFKLLKKCKRRKFKQNFF